MKAESNLNFVRLDAHVASRYRTSAVKITGTLSRINVLRSMVVLLLLAAAFSGCTRANSYSGPTGSPSAPEAYPGSELIVPASWLWEHRGDASLRIIDLSPIGEYQHGHIPGAVHLWWQDAIELHNDVYGMMAGKADLLKMIRDVGITPESRVVLYDNDGNRWAARMLWVLNANGFSHVSLLNGGLQAWTANGYDLTTVNPSLPAGQLDLALNYDVLIGADAIEAHLGDPDYVFLDNRTSGEQHATWYGRLRLGTIPGAKLVPWTAVTQPGAVPYFASPDTLSRVFRDAGVTPDKKIVVYGIDGVSAGLTYVALKLLGYPSVWLYDGSWAEWGSNASLPIAPLPEPAATTTRSNSARLNLQAATR